MNKEKQEKYRKKLIEVSEDIRGREGELKDEALRQTSDPGRTNLSSAPIHLGDLSSDQYEQEVAAELVHTEREILREVADAMDRLQQGTYGRCEDCGEDIAAARLDAVPYARYCIECAERNESAQ